jgi:tripartite-type tricarboxylate transporter receptor subunit TctC
MHRREFLGLTASTLLTGASARAGAWPERPVKLILPYAPGGATDLIGRPWADKLAQAFGQQFVIENRGGASGIIGTEAAAKATPDGYTLLVATNTGQAIAPHLLKLSFDPLKQLQPVGLIVVVPNVLVVGSSVPFNSVTELVAAAKAKPNELKFASSGVGSTQHIAGEAFNQAAGVQTVHIPYKGSSQAHVDILSGEVQMMFDTTSSAMPQIKAGRFRPLAVTTPQRVPELPNVPTIAEAGYPAAEMTTWYAMYVTAGTPKPIVDKLHVELERIVQLPDVQSRLRSLGGEPARMPIDQFVQMQRAEYERFGKLIKAANIHAEGS